MTRFFLFENFLTFMVFLLVAIWCIKKITHVVIACLVLLAASAILGAINYCFHFVQTAIFLSACITALVTFGIGMFLPKTEKEVAKTKEKSYQKAQVHGLEVENVFAGIYIGGAAGSAKTRGVLVPLMKHFSKHNFANIIYCYKDFELVEYGLPLFKNDTILFAPSRPDYTDKINIINPDYFDSEEDIRSLFNEMMANITRGKKQDEKSTFFRNAAVGLATGLTWILKKDQPAYCTLPHLASIVTNKDVETLSKMVASNDRARVQASTFLASTGDQMAAVIGSVYNFFVSFLTPAFCYAMYDKSGKYRNIKVNRPENPITLYLVNEVSKESVVLPVINSVLYLAINLLTKGEQYRTSLLVDEGSTINLEGFSRKPATLRSYEVATVFMIQDLSLAVENSNEVTPRAIISNLSAQFFGKINDPKTGKYYEEIFEYVEKEQFSYSNDSLFLSRNWFNTRVNESKKEQKKYRIPDMYALRTGEFLHFKNGVSKKTMLNYKTDIATTTVPKKRTVTQLELNNLYEEILAFGKNFSC